MPHRQKGFTLIELLTVVAIILIIAGLALPNFTRSKISVNETSALQTLDALHTACFAYWTNEYGYPLKLSSLGPALESTPAAIQGLNDLLANGTRSGYVFTYTPGPIDSRGNAVSYSFTAVPLSQGITGERSFFTDESGLVRVEQRERATASSSPIS
jgi:type IV pilus assembly protein PilA